jgi:hypothetical protein
LRVYWDLKDRGNDEQAENLQRGARWEFHL